MNMKALEKNLDWMKAIILFFAHAAEAKEGLDSQAQPSCGESAIGLRKA